MIILKPKREVKDYFLPLSISSFNYGNSLLSLREETRFLTISGGVPERIVLPSLLGGANIWITWVAEPASPQRFGSISISKAESFGISVFFAPIYLFRDGILG